MNRFLSIDVLRGVIMIIMAIDHVIGQFGLHSSMEIKNSLMFFGYSNPSEQWSRLITHLCAPGFQLLAGMGLALSVARSQQTGKADWKISLDLVTRGVVLILAEFVLMYPIFKWPYFFMVLSCIGVCTLCFEFLRHLPRFHILLIGLAIILQFPFMDQKA